VPLNDEGGKPHLQARTHFLGNAEKQHPELPLLLPTRPLKIPVTAQSFAMAQPRSRGPRWEDPTIDGDCATSE